MKNNSPTSITASWRLRALQLAFLLLLPLAAQATTFPVTTTADSGAGSLREAIDLANANAGPDDITFSTTGTLTLATTLPSITEAVTITGSPGFVIASTVTVFQITGGASDVTIQNMDLSAATVTTNTSSGTIRIIGGSSNVLIENNNFVNASGTAIDINNATNVIINNNDFTGRRRVLFTIPVDGLTVTNNDMTNTGNSGPSTFQLNLTTNLLMHSNNFMGVEHLFSLQNFVDLDVDTMAAPGTEIVLKAADNYSDIDRPFSFSGSNNVNTQTTVSNLVFTAGNNTAIEIGRGNGYTLSNLSIDSRPIGIRLSGSQFNTVNDVLIECSTFTNISGDAISASGNVNTTTVENNSFSCIDGEIIDNNTVNPIVAENNFYGYDAAPVAGDFGGTVDFEPFLSDADACAPDGSTDCPELEVPPTPATALNFDGADDYVLSSELVTLFGPIPTTFEFWYKEDAVPGAVDSPFGIAQSNGDSRYFFLPAATFGPTSWFHQNVGGYDLTNTTLPINEWRHIAVTYDGAGNLKGYINGAPAPNPTGTQIFPVITGRIILGAIGSSTQGSWAGSLDEVRVWTEERSAQEIADNYDRELTSMPPCLVAYYKMNQGFVEADNTGETTADDTATNLQNDGTLTGFDLTGTVSNWTEGSGITAVNSVYDPFSEIDITGNGQNIADGDNSATAADGTDFGIIAVGQSASATFTITNSGTGDLDLTAYTSDQPQFTFAAGSPTVIAPGQTADFTVEFAPTNDTPVNATIAINNNDCDEDPYTFAVTGAGEFLAAAALNFDGTGDHVAVPSSASLNSYATTGELTLEFWIRPTAASQSIYTIISKSNAGNNQGFVIEHYSNELHTWIRYAGGWIDAPVTLTQDEWQHVAIVAKATSGTDTYVNGVLENSTSASGSFSASLLAMRIGADSRNAGATRFLGGDMDEVRIWERALCAAEIMAQKDCELSGTESGLVAYYDFNHGNVGADNSAETTLTDKTANGNDGTLTNFDDLATGGSISNWVAPGAVVTGSACGTVDFPEITVNNATSSTDFGTVLVGSTADLTYTITNDGDADLDIASISVDNGLFTVPATVTTIAAGATLDFTVTYAPTSTGTTSGTVSIQSNDCDEDPYTFMVSGEGRTPVWVAMPFTSDMTTGDQACICNGTQFVTANSASGFGLEQLSGDAEFSLSHPLPIQVRNRTSAGSNNGDIWVITADNGPWASFGSQAVVSGTNNEVITLTLTSTSPAGGYSAAASNFIIDKTDSSGGGLLFFYDEASCPNSSVTPEIAVNESTAGIDFGQVTTGTNGTINYTISNSGAGDLIITDITSDNGFFTTSLPANTTIGVGSSETFTVTFAPTAAGAQSATISIENNDCDEDPYTFTVTGEGFIACDAAITSIDVDANCPTSITVNATCSTCTGNLAYDVTGQQQQINDGFFDELAPGTYTVTVSDMDDPGCSATSSVTTTADTEAPTVICGADIPVNTAAGSCEAVVNWTTAGQITFADNCGINGGTVDFGLGAGPVAVTDPSASIGGTYPVGSTPVTYTISDAAGLMASCSFNVVVTDNEDPTIICPADITENTAPGVCHTNLNLTPATATDNCGDVTITTNSRFNGVRYIRFTQNLATTPLHLRELEVYLSGVNIAAGADVTLGTGDHTSSRLTDGDLSLGNWIHTGSTAGQWAEVDLGSEQDIDFIRVYNRGDCCQQRAESLTLEYKDASNNVIHSDNDFDVYEGVNGPHFVDDFALTYSLGDNMVTWTATDAVGNTATCTQTVTIIDNEAPTAICATDFTVNLDANQMAAVDAADINDGSSDNCGTANVNITGGQTAYTCADLGQTYEVTLTVDDGNATSANNSCSTMVTVGDANGNCCDAAITDVAATDEDCPGAEDGTITVTASCTSCTSIEYSIDGTNFGSTNVFTDVAPGTYTVTIQDTGDAGCNATASVTVTAGVDTENPMANCTPSITLTLDANDMASITVADINDGSSDNCGIATLVLSKDEFDCSDVGGGSEFALDFDDFDDHVSFGNQPQYDFTVNDAFTVETWLNPSTTSGGWHGFLGKGHWNASSGFLLYMAGGSIYFVRTGSNYNTSVNHPITANTWTHVAGVYEQGAMTLYVNGVAVSSWAGNGVTYANSSTPLVIGGRNSNAGSGFQDFYPGLMDEVRIWNVARTDLEIAGFMNASLSGQEAGLVGYYPIENGPGSSTVNDLAMGNTANLQNMDPTNDWVAGASNVGSGASLVTLTVTDDNGLVSTCTTEITILDAEAPLTPTLADVTGECDATATAPTTTDNCAGTITGTTTDPLTYTTQGTHIIEWTFDDGNGNVITVDQNVVVEDVTAPTITCPGPISVNPDAGVCTASNVDLGLPTANDNCVTIVPTNDAPASFSAAMTTVTWTANDGVNPAVTCTQVVTLITTDNDQDGVCDSGDLDDDNDGILDTDECGNILLNGSMEDYTSCPNLSSAGTINNAVNWTTSHPTGGQLMVVDATCNSNRPAGGWSTTTGLSGGSDGNNWLGGHNGEDAQVVLDYPLVSGNNYTLSFDAGYVVQPPFTQPGALTIYGVPVGAADYATTNLLGTSGDINNQLSSSNENWQTYTFNFTATTDYDRILFLADYNSGGGSGFQTYMYFDNLVLASDNFSAACDNEDTDGDMMPNYQDTDSDGDNCFDVVEAGYSDPDEDGILGTSPVTVDAQGLVVGQGGYNGTMPAVIDDSNTTACCDITLISATATDEDCPGAEDGTITVTASCTTCTSIEYSIGGAFQASNVFTDVAPGTYTVTIQDSDDASCNATQSVTVAAGVDNSAPTFTCPSDIAVNLGVECELLIPDLITSIVDANDNCGTVSLTQSPIAGTIIASAHNVTETVTITATDDNNQTSSCTVSLTTIDNIPPSYVAFGSGTLADPFTTTLAANGLPTGNYFFNVEGNVFEASVDGDTDGGGWILILNYVHEGGTNPALDIRNTSTPLIGVGILGDDESGSATWGHIGNALFSQMEISELRFYGESSRHNRVVDFTTTHQGTLDYFATGVGSAENIDNNFTPLANHSANIPGNAASFVPNQGDIAMTNFPFFLSGTYHWGIRGGTNRWEVDDPVVGPSSHTIHRVYARSAATPGCPDNITVSTDAGNCDAVVNFSVEIFDNCAGVSLTQTMGLATGSTFPLGTTDQEYVGTDLAGLSTICAFTVTVEDNEAPEITCPADITVGTDPGECFATVTYIEPVGTDNCTGAITTLISGLGSGGTPSVGTDNVTFEVIDVAGLPAQCTFFVTVQDTEAPSAICAADFTVNLDVAQTASVDAAAINNGSSDNCGTANVSITGGQTAYTCADLGQTYEVTLTVDDGNATSANSSCSTMVTVGDAGGHCCDAAITDVVATDEICPGDEDGTITVTATCTTCTSIEYSIGGAFQASNVFTDVAPGIYTVTIQDSDDASCNATQSVTVAAGVDTENPITPSLADVTGECQATATAPTTTDNCAGTITGTTTDPLTYTTQGTHTIEWTFDDGNGNVIMVNQNVIVDDTEAPIAECVETLIVQLDATGMASISVADINDGSTDNCGITSMTIDNSDFDCSDIGMGVTSDFSLDFDGQNDHLNAGNDPTLKITGNQVTLEAWINTPQFVSLVAGDVINKQQLSGEAGYFFRIGGAGQIQFFIGTPVGWRFVQSPANAVTTNTWHHVAGVYNGADMRIYVDGVQVAITTNVTQTIDDTENELCIGCQLDNNHFFKGRIDDTRVWNIARTPAEIAANYNQTLTGNEAGLVLYYAMEDGPGSGMVTDLSSASNDAVLTNMDPATDWVSGVPGLSVGGGGNNEVILTVSDGTNSRTCVTAVTVEDNIAPATPTLVDVTGECSATATVPTTTDNCGTITGTTTDPTTFATQGTHIIEWTFDDGNGNVITANQTVIVDDVTDPATPTLADVTGECQATATAPTTTDNCAGTITGTTTDPLTYTTQGTHQIEWTFDDGNGNVITAMQNVIVEDVTDPVLLACPGNISVECDAVPSPAIVTAMDNCDATLTVDFTEVRTDGANSNEYTLTRTWSATDAAGNTASCSQTIDVSDDTPPVIICAADEVMDNDPGACEAFVSVASPTVTDNCFDDNAPAGTQADPFTSLAQAGSVFGAGTFYFDVDGTQFSTFVECGWIMIASSPSTATTDLDRTTALVPQENTLLPASVYADASIQKVRINATAGAGLPFDVESDHPGTLANLMNDISLHNGLTGGVNEWTGVGAFRMVTGCQNFGVGSLSSKIYQACFNGDGLHWMPTVNSSGQWVTADFANGTSDLNIWVQAATPVLSLTNDITGTCDASGIYPVGTTTITWTATDAAGNTAQCTQDVTVNDTEDPVVACPANITETATSAAGAVVNFVDPVGTDNCPGAATAQTAGLTSGSTFPIGTTPVEFTVTDAAGRTASCSFDVTVSGTAPDILCPDDIIVDADPGACATNVTYAATETAGIPASTITYSIAPGSVFTVSAAVDVTATATNAVGSDACTFTVTVEDNEDPVIPTLVDLTGECVVTAIPPVATDNCAGTVTATTNGPTTFTTVGTETITWTFDDGNGNVVTATQNVTVTDTEPPTITCPADITVSTNSNSCDATVNYPLATAIDNCSVEAFNFFNGGEPNDYGAGEDYLEMLTNGTWNDLPNSSGRRGIVEFNVLMSTSFTGYTSLGQFGGHTYYYADAATPWLTARANAQAIGGDLASMNSQEENDFINDQNVRGWVGGFHDQTAPDFVEPGNSSQNFGGWRWTDGTRLGSGQIDIVQTGGPATGSSFPLGSTPVTYTATDEAGLSSTCTFTVTVEDNTNPIVPTLANVTGECDATATAPTTTDNCAGTITGTTTDDLTYTEQGTYTISWTFDDGNDNIITVNQTVIVDDVTDPEVTCPDDIVMATDAGLCTAVVNFAASATDNCTAAPDLSYSIAAGTAFDKGSTPVMVTADDLNSNTATCTFNVIVNDEEDPLAACNDITIDLIDRNTYSLTQANIDAIAAGTSDNCPGVSYAITAGTTDYDCEDRDAQFVVTLTATDAAGLMNSCTATVTIADPNSVCNDPPVAVCAPYIVEANANCEGTAVATDFDGGSMDPDGDELMFSFTPPGPFAVGTHNVTLFVTDGEFTDQCMTTITVTDETDPVAICVATLPVVLTSAGTAVINVGMVDAGSNDACGIASTVLDITAFDCEDVGPNTVTLTVTDNNDNVNTCQTTVVVSDDTNPIADCQDITVQLDAAGMASITEDAVNALSSDACNGLTFDTDINDFDCTDVGPNTVELTVTDANNNAATCSATVTVEDNVDPVADCQNITVQLDAAGEATITEDAVNGNSSDACGGLTFETNINDFGCANVGPNTVELTVTDANNNAATCTAVVTVEDNVDPQANCMDITVQLDANGMASITSADVEGDGACPGTITLYSGVNYTGTALVLTFGDYNFPALNAGIGNDNTRSVRVSPGLQIEVYSGYIDSSPELILTEDTPTLGSMNSQVSSVIVSCLPGTIPNNGFSDACGISNIDLSQTAFDCTNVGDNTVLVTVTDNNNNVSTCSATVTVEDNVDPVADCQDITIQLDAAGMASIAEDAVNALSSDACNGLNFETDINDFDCTDVGPNTIELTVTDANNNSATCTATVTVEDNVDPVADCQDITVQLDAAGEATITEDAVNALSSDACGGLAFETNINDFGCANVGPNTVELAVTDANNNSATCTATVTVEDNVDPVANCQPVTIQLDANGLATVTPAEVNNNSADACGIQSMVLDNTSFDCADLGDANSVTLTVTDNNNNSATCTAVITVADEIAPTITGCSGDLTETAVTGDCSALVGFGTPVIDDNCEVTISVTCDAPGANIINNNLGLFPVGTSTVVCTVTDAAGNMASCSFDVTVIDDQAPIITGCPATDIVVDAEAGLCAADVLYGIIIASDNCPGVSLSPVSGHMIDGDNFPVGTTAVEFLATDAIGLTTTCAFNVTVNDTQDPMITCPADISVDNDAGLCSAVVDFAATASDNCSVDGIAYSVNPGSVFAVGTTEVTATATDDAGLTAACSFNISVTDNEAPMVTCPADIAVGTDDSECAALVSWPQIATADNCGVASASYLTGGISLNNNGVDPVSGTFPTGTTTITYRVFDVEGNVANCSFDIVVSDDEAPLLPNCPRDPITVAAAADACGVDVDYDDIIVDDNCPGASITFASHDPTGDFFSVGVTTVTINAQDAAGNTSNCVFDITVVDQTAPLVICTPDTITLDVNGQASISISDVFGGASDNCQINDGSVAIDQSNFGCSEVGVQGVTVSIADIYGNVGSCVAEVTVVDDSAPTAVCATIDLVLGTNGQATITADQLDGGSSDNCGIESFFTPQLSFGCGQVGENFQPLTVVDVNGNSSQCTAQINVIDNTLPSVVCQDISINLDASGAVSITASQIDNGSADACGVADLSLDITGFGCADVGDNTVVLSVTDENDNTASCTATVTVNDITPPTMVCVDIDVNLDATGAASITTADVDGGSSDACSISSLSLDVSSFGCADVGLNTVVLTAVDANNNSASCNATVNVIDDVAPVANCNDLMVSLNAAGNVNITPAQIDDNSTDACGIASLSLDVSSFDCSNTGANTVELTVTDNNGNSSTCTSTVNVVDDTAPAALCSDLTIQLDANGVAAIDHLDIDGGSNDACGISSSVASQINFGCADVGANTVTLTVTDPSGNSNSCDATVTVQDVTAPEVTCQDVTLVLDAINGEASLTVADVQATLFEACGIQSVTIDNDFFDCASTTSNNLVTLTAVDVNGNSNSCVATITVIDQTAPTAICQDVVIVELGGNGEGFITAMDADFGSYDNCAIVDYAVDQDFFNCDDVGNNDVTLTVTDAAGLTSTCVFNTFVVEKVQPNVVCQDITVELDANGQVVVSASQINDGSTDNCGLAQLELDITDFDCNDAGDNAVILTVTDSNNNADTCSATVTVVDVSMPIMACMDVTIALDPQTGTVAITPADVDGGSTDNCGITNLSLSANGFDCSQIGNNPVSLTATDAAGNTASCTANVNIIDNTDPSVDCQDITISLSADLGRASIEVADVASGIFDACGVASSALDVTNFDCTDVGDNMVTVTVTDLNANVTTCVATVTVVDDVDPQALCQDVTIQLDANGAASISIGDIDAGSNDACGISDLTLSKSNFDCADTGDNTISLLVEGTHGNTSICTATVTVEDVSAPSALCQDVSISLDASGAASITTADVDAGSADNCGVAELSLSKIDFGCADVGTQSVILTVTDPSGLQTQCQATVSVSDDVLPQVVCNDLSINLNAAGQASINVGDIDGGANDACGLASVTIDIKDFDCDDTGANTVTLTAMDNNGNVATCTSTVIISDNIDPTAECRDITVTLDASGNASITNATVDNGSTDNCSFGLSLSQYNFGYSDYPSTTVTLTATDASGNSDQCTATVTVIVPCDNVTSGGAIAATEFGCGAFDPALISSVSPASGGGNAPIEYLWLSSTDPELPVTQWTTVGMGLTFNPPTISETTYYIRCARRLGCNVYMGESNVVTKIVNDEGEACAPGDETVYLSGNAVSYFNNHGVSSASNIIGAIDGNSAKFYHYNDNIRVLLPDFLPAGSQVTITWKRRNYGGYYPARLLVYENTTNGNGSHLNDIFYTQVSSFYISSTITLDQDGVSSLWLRNAPGYADFEIDAITYCATACESNVEYCTPDDISTEYEYIRRVKLRTINNWSWDDNGYGDYTNLSTNLERGYSYNIRLRPGFHGSSYIEFWTVYMDFDQDGEFESHELVYYGRGRHEKSGTVHIPTWARAGQTRMRVVMRYGGYGSPCSDHFEGEIEDYTVNLTGGDIIVGWRPGQETTDAEQLSPLMDELLADEQTIIRDRSDAQSIDTEELSSAAATFEPSMKVYPSPTSGPVTIDLAGFEAGQPVLLVITNHLGQDVLRRNLSQGGDQSYTIYPADQGMLPGTYLVSAASNGELITKRLVVVR